MNTPFFDSRAPARATWALALLATIAPACGTNEERYAEKYPEFYCAYIQSCDPPFYDSIEECQGDVDGAAPGDGCTFDEAAADACLGEISGLTCEGSASNYPSVCNEVWVCP